MKSAHHAALSLAVSGLLYAAFSSWAMAASAFVSGVFIDLDHVPDYVREKGFPFRLKDFSRHYREKQPARLFLVLHGWEWLFLLAAAAWWSGWDPWAVGLLVGFGHHLITDQLFNELSPMCYFFLWRWKKGFQSGPCFHREGLP